MQAIFLLCPFYFDMSKIKILQIFKHVATSELAYEHFQCELAEKTQFT